MQPIVMGILNVTPDSFFDGGRYIDPEQAVRRGREMIAQGAQIIDIGGESTRPGAAPVSVADELERVIPVITALAKDVRVSIDTMKADVAKAAVDAGATLVNDVSSTLIDVSSSLGVGLIVMHMQGSPTTMQVDPHYDDVVADVTSYLQKMATAAREAGITEIYVDPGIGFGKTAEHNLALLKALPELVVNGTPVAVGVSRKSFIGKVNGEKDHPLPVDDRFEGSLAATTWALSCGAAIVRVHDVAATVAAAKLIGDVAEQLHPTKTLVGATQ